MKKTNRKSTRPIKLKCFRDAQKFFGPPPVLMGEDTEAYYALGQAIWEARSPQEFIEVSWINDITYHLWEAHRLRRMKLHLIDADRLEAIKILASNLSNKPSLYFNEEFWQNWLKGDANTVELVELLLKRSELPDEAITAISIQQNMETLEKFEKQSSQFEARRMAAIRESDNYREYAEQRRERLSRQRQTIGKPRGHLVSKQDQNLAQEVEPDFSAEAAE